CNLVILAALLGILAMLGRTGFQMWFLRGDADPRMFGYVMMGFSGVGWVSRGLLIVAVFAGRNPPTPTPYRPDRFDPRDDDEWDRPAAAPKKTEDATGIQAK